MNSSSLHDSSDGVTSGIHIAPFDNSVHRDQVVAMWETIFAYPAPHNRPSLSIDRKIGVRDDLFFVALDGTEVVGTTMAGYDGHRGYIYSVAVLPSHRKQGIATALVTRAEEALAARGCPKINLQILEGNEDVAAFYASLGYAVERRTNMGKILPAPAE